MKQRILILLKLDKINYKVQFSNKEVKTLKKGVKLDTPLNEMSQYDVEINKDYINKATLVRKEEKVSQNEYNELIDLIKKKELEVKALDRKSLSSLFCNANDVASNSMEGKEWDYDLWERISNEVYLTNLNRFLRINNR
jgi:hypothetical protein